MLVRKTKRKHTRVTDRHYTPKTAFLFFNLPRSVTLYINIRNILVCISNFVFRLYTNKKYKKNYRVPHENALNISNIYYHRFTRCLNVTLGQLHTFKGFTVLKAFRRAFRRNEKKKNRNIRTGSRKIYSLNKYMSISQRYHQHYI